MPPACAGDHAKSKWGYLTGDVGHEYMSRNPRIGELSAKRSLLKDAGQFHEAIPLQLEIIELLQEEDPDPDRLANAHNMASVLYLRAKLYSSAEWHGRQALALKADGDSAKDHEALGAFNLVMARILASRSEIEAATDFGQSAISEYSHWHTPADDFLLSIIDEVQSIKDSTWTTPE